MPRPETPCQNVAGRATPPCHARCASRRCRTPRPETRASSCPDSTASRRDSDHRHRRSARGRARMAAPADNAGQAAHQHRPVVGGVAAIPVQAPACRGAAQRDETEVDPGRQTPVHAQFLAAGLRAQRRCGEIQQSLAYRLLQLQHPVAGQEDPGAPRLHHLHAVAGDAERAPGGGRLQEGDRHGRDSRPPVRPPD